MRMSMVSLSGTGTGTGTGRCRDASFRPPSSARHLVRSWRPRTLEAKAFSSAASASQARGFLPRFYSEVLLPSKGNIVRVQGDEFWHITRVLRFNVDDRVGAFQWNGDLEVYIPKSTQWHVYSAFGTLKGGRADWLIEKCTELGASSVTPLLTERSPAITENRVDRWERVTLAATKQCQRLQRMVLNHPTTIHDLLPIVSQSKLSFLAEAEAVPLMKGLNGITAEPSGILMLGPEGDFTQGELKLLTEAGATSVGFGPFGLHVEMAAVSLLSALMLWADSQAVERR